MFIIKTHLIAAEKKAVNYFKNNNLVLNIM